MNRKTEGDRGVEVDENELRQNHHGPNHPVPAGLLPDEELPWNLIEIEKEAPASIIALNQLDAPKVLKAKKLNLPLQKNNH